MFKLILLVALINFAAARPGILAPTIIHEPAVLKVGHVVHSIPSAVSHQSHTQIHTRPVITPVLTSVVHPVSVVHTPILHSHVVASPIVAHHGPILVHG